MAEIDRLDMFRDVRRGDFEAGLKDGMIRWIGDDVYTAFIETVKKESLLLPVQDIYRELPCFTAPPSLDILVHNGGRIPAGTGLWDEGTRLRILDSEGHFIGIYRKEKEELVPEKMFLVGLT